MKVMNRLKRALHQVTVEVSRYQQETLVQLIGALVQARSVNLQKLACSFASPAQVASTYRRLQRFFSGGLSPQVFTELIVQRLVKPGKPVFLTLDRTHWKRGQRHNNLLCLGILHKRVSVPMVSMSLEKAGNSHTKERKKLLRAAFKHLPVKRCCLLADREFIGKEWIQFLQRQKMTFVLRIRSNHWIQPTQGDGFYLDLRSRHQRRNTTKIYENIRLYKDLPLHLVCHRSAKGERIFLVTNRTDLHQIVPLYRQRWSIETAFGFFKSKGFDLETTRLMHPDRIHRLLGVLSLCLLWGLLVGDALQRAKAIPIKKHGRRAGSLVRRGLDQLQYLWNQPHQQPTLRAYARLLVSCT